MMNEVTLIQIVNDIPMLNTKNLADMFEREHSHVMRSLRGLIDEGFIGQSEFVASSYTNLQNKQQPCYNLTEKAAMIAMPFIGGKKAKEGQVKLVTEFIDYRKQTEQLQIQKRPESRLEWMQEAVRIEQELVTSTMLLEQKESQIVEDTPKVEFYNTVVADTEILYTMSEAAKLLSWGPRIMNKVLREEGWLLKTTRRLEPTQALITRGIFEYKLMNTFTDVDTYIFHETHKCHVTGKGLVALRKLKNTLDEINALVAP